MSRMQSPETARITARTDKTLKSEFKRACEHNDESMTDVLETMMRKYVDDHGPISSSSRSQSEYVPDDPSLREIYQVCLDVAVNGTHGPTIYQRRHASAITQKTQQISKDELADAMARLRRNGYATIGAMPPERQGESAKRWRNWVLSNPLLLIPSNGSLENRRTRPC